MNPYLKYIPNILTASRVVITLATVALLLTVGLPAVWVSVLMLFAAATDFFDGKVARRFGIVSLSGAIADPIADKVCILSIGALLTWWGQLPLWFCLALYLRNVSQLVAVPILFAKAIGFKVKPKLPARIGTTMSFLVVFCTHLWFDYGIIPQVLPSAEWLLLFLTGVSFLLEVQIFITFIIRFVQILRGTHDTFE